MFRALTYNVNRLTPARALHVAAEVLAPAHGVHAAVLCETELPRSELASLPVHFPQYKLFTHVLTKTDKARVVVLAHEELEVAQLPHLQVPDLPMVWLCFPQRRLVLGGLYRPWSSGADRGLPLEKQQLGDLCRAVARAAAEFPSDDMCVLGDVNLDMAKRADPRYPRRQLLVEWLATIESAALSWCPTDPACPTYKSYGQHDGCHRTSVIDHIYASPRISAAAVVLPTALTDHFPVRVDLPAHPPAGCQGRRLERVVIRDFKGIDYAALSLELERMGVSSWPAPPPGMSADAVLEDLLSILRPLIDKFAPPREIRVRRDTPPLFLARDTRATMRLRDAARARGLRSYRSLRNRAARLVRRDRMRTAVRTLQESGDRHAGAWKLARSLLSPKTPLPLLENASSDLEAAEAQSCFYVAKVEALRAGLPGTTSGSDSDHAGPDRPPFCLRPVGPYAVCRVLQRLGSTRAVGVDGIPTIFWRRTAHILAPAVCHLINCSFRESEVPELFKSALVVPDLKKGKATLLPSSYRPVSILPALSKALERLVLEQLVSYCDEHCLIPRQQHGSRRSHSTLTALASATHAWGTALAPRSEGGRSADCLAVAAFDYSSAFDTISPGITIDSLRCLGCTEATLGWFQSYMTGGRQAVVWNNATSSMRPVPFGVRQGSILGPALFSIVTRFFPKAVGDDSVVYVDDTTAWSDGTVEATLASLSLKCGALVEQAGGLELVLNAGKTQLLLGGPGVRSRPPGDLRVTMAESSLRPAKNLDLLGIAFDDRLSPAPGLARLKGSLARLVGTAIRTRPHLPPDVHLTMMQALVNGTTGAHAAALVPLRLGDEPSPEPLQQAQVLLNDAARASIGVRRADRLPVRDVLARAGFVSLNQACFRSAALLAWNAMKNSGHPLHSILAGRTLDSRTRAAAAGELLPVPPRTAAVSVTIANAVRAWNSLSDLRAAQTKGAAKTAIRKALGSVPI